MTIPPIQGSGANFPPFRIPVVTGPVSTGVPPVIGDDPLALPHGAPPSPAGTPPREDAPITLAGRLDSGDVLPETTQLALALESATRAMQNGRADQVLSALDAVWSQQLASDSPWYLRTAALQLLGRMTDAEQVIRDAIERLPRSAALLYLLGVHTASRGQPDAARLANDHALALHPTEPLLWLQRAALASTAGLPDNAAAILEHVQSMEPAFPAPQWLATLMRLGIGVSRAPTPVVQRAIERLTPSSLPAISDAPAHDVVVPFANTPLETAVRYGLTLLDSPTHSARIATQGSGSRETIAACEEIGSRAAFQPTPPVVMPSWEALIFTGGLLVIAFVPSLRVPALMSCGAMTMLMVSRRRR